MKFTSTTIITTLGFSAGLAVANPIARNTTVAIFELSERDVMTMPGTCVTAGPGPYACKVGIHNPYPCYLSTCAKKGDACLVAAGDSGAELAKCPVDQSGFEGGWCWPWGTKKGANPTTGCNPKMESQMGPLGRIHDSKGNVISKRSTDDDPEKRDLGKFAQAIGNLFGWLKKHH